MASITVDATRENISKVSSFVEAELERLNCPMKETAQINVAVDELLSNIVNYAYPNAVGKASLIVEAAGQNAVRITFEDSGVPYNPLAKADPDISLSAEERKIGGLGIFIVKKTMDGIVYKFENGKNILAIEKKW